MEPVAVGVLSGMAAVVSLLLWRQLAWLPVDGPGERGGDSSADRGGPGPEGAESWRERYRSTVRALRLATAWILFLLGFLTGWMLVFLKATTSA